MLIMTLKFLVKLVEADGWVEDRVYVVLQWTLLTIQWEVVKEKLQVAIQGQEKEFRQKVIEPDHGKSIPTNISLLKERNRNSILMN